MSDLATCEWIPASSRSIVSIEQAAERVPMADRAELIRQFNQRIWVDRIRIEKDRIVSMSDFAVYKPQIVNMNHDRGRICRTVTRKKWKLSDYQEALTFYVNGSFYSYAAACGNLFTVFGVPLPPKEKAPPPAAETPPTAEAAPEIPPVALAPPVDLAGPPPVMMLAPPEGVPFTFAEGTGPSIIWPGAVIFGPVFIGTPGSPVTAIPEPPIWALSLVGIGLAILLFRRLRA